MPLWVAAYLDQAQYKSMPLLAYPAWRNACRHEMSGFRQRRKIRSKGCIALEENFANKIAASVANALIYGQFG
jgi:hypothetical protein